MSHYRRQPFKMSQGDQGGWVVDFEGTAVEVCSLHEATLLADLPLQLHKAVSTDEEPDLNRIKDILLLCREYGLDRRFSCVRHLRTWFKRHTR